jgi:hypothetical protein
MVSGPNRYSVLVLACMKLLKWLGLGVVGFAIAYILSACLQAFGIVSLLLSLASALIVPVLSITLCIVAIVVVVESWR